MFPSPGSCSVIRSAVNRLLRDNDEIAISGGGDRNIFDPQSITINQYHLRYISADQPSPANQLAPAE